MTSEFLLEAIGRMDDELVTEAAEPARRSIPWLKVSGWAAALLLCVGVASLPALMPWNGTGTAAPEAEHFFSDALLDQDTAADDYEYRSEQESQIQTPSATDKENTKAEASGTVADGAMGGVFEPCFFTERGVYMLMGEDFPYEPQMPLLTHATALGNLAASIPGEQVYPSTGTPELVGCPVWESADGKTLYIELPDGGCLVAHLHE